MPEALAIGITANEFWSLNPRKIKPYEKAFRLKLKNENQLMYLQGQYMMCAINSTVGNMFRSKGTKPIEYPDKPFDIFEEPKRMSEKDKREETEKLFMQLKIMQSNFNANKGNGK